MYGSCGMYTCILYSLHVAPSVTTSGRSCISTAGLQIEMFLSNNVKFSSLNEVITFIDNVCNQEDRKFKDSDILDRDIPLDECFTKIMLGCGFDSYIPSKKDCNIVWEMLSRLSQEDINRLYYKNNLYEFMNNSTLTNAMIYILKSLKTPYLNPGKPPKEIKVEIGELLELLKEYVYYPHQIIDRLDRYRIMGRKSCVITDTDSVICSLDAWYRFGLEKVKGIDMNIKHELISLTHLKLDEFGDIDEDVLNSRPLFKKVECNEDYDFYDDEVIELEKEMNPTDIIPQEGLKHSIINIMSYCLGEIINDYILKYSINSNAYEEGKKCLLYLKNEFEFKRILLTGVMKSYASKVAVQEGHLVPEESSMDIKGLPMMKATANERTQQKLKEILYEEVLNRDDIDQVRLLKELAKFEKEIFESLNSGEKTFYSPRNLRSIGSYANPLATPGVKQCLFWNEIRGDQPAIDTDERNHVDIVKLDMNPKNIGKLRNVNEEMYNKISALFKEPEFKTGINGLAIPLDGTIPKWLIPFIDFASIINDNLSLFPIESVGLERFNKSNNYTNIIHM